MDDIGIVVVDPNLLETVGGLGSAAGGLWQLGPAPPGMRYMKWRRYHSHVPTATGMGFAKYIGRQLGGSSHWSH